MSRTPHGISAAIDNLTDSVVSLDTRLLTIERLSLDMVDVLDDSGIPAELRQKLEKIRHKIYFLSAYRNS